MNPTVLSGRRRVFPSISRPCVAPGWIYSFEGAGAPFFEPGFGVVIPRETARDEYGMGQDFPDAHGVAHYITADEFFQIVKTEGGSGYPELGYSVVPVECTFTDGEASTITALTLGAGRRDFVRPGVLPSKRYWKLVWEGANYWGVDRDYIRWLETQPWYEPTTTGKKLARYVWGALLMTLIVPAFLVSRICASLPGGLDYYIQRYWIGTLRRFFWGTHDSIFVYIFGNGCNNMDNPNAKMDIPVFNREKIQFN
jgi:hypothetical protein